MEKLWEDNVFLSDDFHVVVEPEDVPKALKEMTERTLYSKTDPSYLEIYSVVKQKRCADGSKGIVLAHIEPTSASINMLIAETPEECYFKKENNTLGELSTNWFKKNGMSDELIEDILREGFFYQYKDVGEIKTYLPSKYTLAVLCKQIGAGKAASGINPLRDLYLASIMNCNNDITLISRTGDKYNKVFGVLASDAAVLPQTAALDVIEQIRKNESANIIHCDINHSRTLVDVEMVDRDIYGYHPVIRIRIGNIGRLKTAFLTGLNCKGQVLITGEFSASNTKRKPEAKEVMALCLEQAMKELNRYPEKFRVLSSKKNVPDPTAKIKKLAKSIKFSEHAGAKLADEMIEKICAKVESNEERDVYKAFISILNLGGAMHLMPYKMERLSTAIGNMF